MKKHSVRAILFLTLFLSLSAVALPRLTEADERFQDLLNQFVKTSDPLGLRIVLKAYADIKKKNVATWRIARHALEAMPQSGYDLLFVWKFLRPNSPSPLEEKISTEWQKAIQLMLKKQYQESAEVMIRVASSLRIMLDDATDPEAKKSLMQLYPFALHSLGRALFGAGDYKSALQVYDWIPSGYAPFRQVLFEKMWVAYQLGDAERTLAAIASQKSAYFSPYLEPEAYLIQVYMYKRLCRVKELENVLKELRNFQTALDNGRFDIELWSTWDFENYVLFSLIKKKNIEERNGITTRARLEEVARIQKRLEKGYAQDRRRLQGSIGKLIAFANMAVLSNSTRTLNPISKLPSRADLLKSGFEVWPFDLGEEWIDEIGTQRFLGESQCAQR